MKNIHLFNKKKNHKSIPDHNEEYCLIINYPNLAMYTWFSGGCLSNLDIDKKASDI